MNFLISLKEFKDHIFKKENIYFYIFVVTIFFFDRLSKLQIINNLNEAPYYVNDFINLELIWNIGIGFGLLSTVDSLFYNLVTLIIGLVILYLFYLLILSDKIGKLIYSIIIGGALGNFYDRLVYKAVPDFIDLHYNNFHWFVFNLADIFISLGIFFLILEGFIRKSK